MTSLTEEFPELFSEGMGKIRDIFIKLHIDPDLQPVAQCHRCILFHVHKGAEKELERLESLDIIEKVNGATPWVSPIVAVPKKNKGVHICVNMRDAKQAIKHEKHIMPTTDDFIHELNEATVFSKLDLTNFNNVSHQLELSEESRFITTFTTHVHLCHYKRLLFRVNTTDFQEHHC